MFVERSAQLIDHDAVAVRGGGDTLVFYADRLTRAQRRVLRAHLLTVLCNDEPSVTIAVPAGWTAAEVSARQRGHEPLTAGAILFSVAAAAVLTAFVAAVIILVVNEHRNGHTMAQAPIPPLDGRARPAVPAPVTGQDAPRPEQPAGASAPPAGEAGQAVPLPDDVARTGDPQPPPVLEAATSEHAHQPRLPALKSPDLPVRPEAPRVPVVLTDPPAARGPAPGPRDVEPRDERDVESELPDVELPDVEVPDRKPVPSRPVDRDEDDVPEQDGAEHDGDDDHDARPAPEGDSCGDEEADGREDLGVDLDR